MYSVNLQCDLSLHQELLIVRLLIYKYNLNIQLYMQKMSILHRKHTNDPNQFAKCLKTAKVSNGSKDSVNARSGEGKIAFILHYLL